MNNQSSYGWRKKLQYDAGEKPKFLQDLEQKAGDRDREILKEQQRQRLAHRNTFSSPKASYQEESDEMPVLVDSEGNVLPPEFLEGEVKFDLQFSDLPTSELHSIDDRGEMEEHACDKVDSDEDAKTDRTFMKRRKGHLGKTTTQISQTKSPGRFVSFNDDDL